jgi:hypothetical protein
MSQDHKYRENTKHVQKQETRFPEVTFTSAFSDINNQIDTSVFPVFVHVWYFLYICGPGSYPTEKNYRYMYYKLKMT